MTPPLYLSLDVGTGKKVVPLFYVSIHVYSAIATRSSHRDIYEAAPLHDPLDELFEFKRRNLKMPLTNPLKVSCRSDAGR